jgi:hypothetical protein
VRSGFRSASNPGAEHLNQYFGTIVYIGEDRALSCSCDRRVDFIEFGVGDHMASQFLTDGMD